MRAEATVPTPAIRIFRGAQHESGDYVRWSLEHAFAIVPAQAIVVQHLASFQQFRVAKDPALSLLNRLWKI
jgi:hypothetical protein